MKLKEIYNLIDESELLEIRKNGKSYILKSTYDFLDGYHIFKKETTILIDDFKTFKIDNRLLIESEVLQITCYEVLDSSELHIANVMFIGVL